MRRIANALRARGVVGINRRNRDLILRYNPRRLFPLVDDKVRTKELARAAGIPTPDLYAVLRTEREARRLPDLLERHPSCAIKPAHGAGGDGILVLDGRRGARLRRSNGLWLLEEEVAFHVSNVLSGVYSLGAIRDVAMVEARVEFSSHFEHLSHGGVPDIRVVVLRGYPVMAMVRLPTRQSDGRANLHQGAVGAGVDIGSGRTQEGVWLDERIAHHPDTGEPIAGVEIPEWGSILTLAARCHDITGLGYLGVDVVLDRQRGPLLLELNARPGLGIQIANDAGLDERCRAVEAALARGDRSAAERASYARERFASPAGSRAA